MAPSLNGLRTSSVHLILTVIVQTTTAQQSTPDLSAGSGACRHMIQFEDQIDGDINVYTTRLAEMAVHTSSSPMTGITQSPCDSPCGTPSENREHHFMHEPVQSNPNPHERRLHWKAVAGKLQPAVQNAVVNEPNNFIL